MRRAHRPQRAHHRRYCPSCGVLIPGHDQVTRSRRAQAIAAKRAELERWRKENPDASADSEDFRSLILPGLAQIQIKLSEIMTAPRLRQEHS